MTPLPALDEDLLRRLPLPLAHLHRRAHNAKGPQERHHAAYYLWEAALKLLGAVAVVEYAELGDQDAELAERLRNLARPSLGHWWEFVRRLVPVLAERGDRGFAAVRELLLGKTRDDLPHAAGLDAVLVQALGGRDAAGAQATVRLAELFDRLVRYRNREFGHGAVGQRPAAFYDRVGRALLAGVPELLGRLDVLAGRRLLYVADVRRHASGRWLVERYELRGEAARRLESLDLPDGEAVRRLLPDRVCLEAVPRGPSAPGAGDEGRKSGEQGPRAVSLHPLLVYEADGGEALFLSARRGRQRTGYPSYTTGREVERTDEDTLWTQNFLGPYLEEDGELAEAEPLLRQGLEACKRALGPNHKATLRTQNDLALVLNRSQGKHEEAGQLLRQAIELSRNKLGPEHPSTLYGWVREPDPDGGRARPVGCPGPRPCRRVVQRVGQAGAGRGVAQAAHGAAEVRMAPRNSARGPVIPRRRLRFPGQLGVPRRPV